MKIFLLACLISFNVFADVLPDPKLTPGVAREVDVNTLCTTSTKLVRNTSEKTKKLVYSEYGLSAKRLDECTGPSHSCYEIDHLIPLEDGGADVEANLWPQLYDGEWGAHKKDKLENFMHKQICTGKITIKEAQACLSKDWVSCYKQKIGE